MDDTVRRSVAETIKIMIIYQGFQLQNILSISILLISEWKVADVYFTLKDGFT